MRLSGPSLFLPPQIPVSEPDLILEHKQAVICSLRWAWGELVRRHSESILAYDEETITVGIQDLLNERKSGRRVAWWLEGFETVTRGESQKTSDGRLQKKPDLTFRPFIYGSVMNTSHWGWFVECKLIDGEPSVGAYRDKGIQRFCKGEYAAWMKSGAMLAYVRDGKMPLPSLEKVLSSYSELIAISAESDTDIVITELDRSLLPRPCVNFTLQHIWLHPEH